MLAWIQSYRGSVKKGCVCLGRPGGPSQKFKQQMWILHKAVKTVVLNTTVI